MNENIPLISVIIPVYNMEAYLARCLFSAFTRGQIKKGEMRNSG